TSTHFPLERPGNSTFNLAKARERRPSPVLLLIAGDSGNEPLAKDFSQLIELCIDGVHRALGRDNLRLRDDMSPEKFNAIRCRWMTGVEPCSLVLARTRHPLPFALGQAGDALPKPA